MTLRIWALKVSELKPLSRAGRLLLAVRCALRVAPWGRELPGTLWSEGLDHVTRLAFQPPDGSGQSETLAHELLDQGANLCNGLAGDDEVLGECSNHAACTLAAAVETTILEDGPALKKAVLDIAKQSASIPAVLAHAGCVPTQPGADPVDVACLAIWNAIREDVAIVAANTPALETADQRLVMLRDCAPLWLGSTPEWAER